MIFHLNFKGKPFAVALVYILGQNVSYAWLAGQRWELAVRSYDIIFMKQDLLQS